MASLGPLNGANDSTAFGVRSPSFSANNFRTASKDPQDVVEVARLGVVVQAVLRDGVAEQLAFQTVGVSNSCRRVLWEL